MAQSLDLNAGGPAPKIRRLNRLPVIAAILFVVLFFGAILYALAGCISAVIVAPTVLRRVPRRPTRTR